LSLDRPTLVLPSPSVALAAVLGWQRDLCGEADDLGCIGERVPCHRRFVSRLAATCAPAMAVAGCPQQSGRRSGRRWRRPAEEEHDHG
jgi:hypothetical protein